MTEAEAISKFKAALEECREGRWKFVAVAPEPITAVLAALEREKKRLDWLEGNQCTNLFKIGNRWYSRAGYSSPHHRESSLRAAVDAALSQHEQGASQ